MMILLTLASAPLLAAQATADQQASPKQWEITYDIAIQPYLEDYRRCLGYGNRLFDGEANVELQHRADVPRCMKVREKAIAESNAALVRRGRTADMPPAEVERTFDTLGQIHIARGADLDKQFTIVLVEGAQRREDYEEQRGEALVMELHDASVVKSAAEVAGQNTKGAIE